MEFNCSDDKNEWTGKITNITNRGNYYEFWIISRSSIMTILGSTSRGNFICIPDFNVGCHLVNLKDTFWNKEKLVSVLGKADGITVAAAIEKLSDTLIL
jgi:hypothetical protein